MIVNYTETGWEIITQRTHGMLAAQIASHWNQAIRSERWLETLLAIAEHDDAQVELESDDLLTPQGGPVNFKMKVFEQKHCTKTIECSLSKSRYIALLSSMHLDFVYRKSCPDDLQAIKFLKSQKIQQRKWCKELRLTAAEAARDYRLLEWCDALSLLLCQHENQPKARSIEVSNGPEDKSYQLIQRGPQTLTVAPWPFEENEFEMYFETRLIPKLSVKNNAEFRSAFRQATVGEKRWVFKKEEPLK